MSFSCQLYSTSPGVKELRKELHQGRFWTLANRISKGRFSFALSNENRHSFSAFCTTHFSGAHREHLTVLVLMTSSVRHQTWEY